MWFDEFILDPSDVRLANITCDNLKVVVLVAKVFIHIPNKSFEKSATLSIKEALDNRLLQILQSILLHHEEIEKRYAFIRHKFISILGSSGKSTYKMYNL